MLVRSTVKKDHKPSSNPAVATESPQQPMDDNEGAAPPLKTGEDEMEIADEPVKVEIEELTECSMAPEEVREDDSLKFRGKVLGSNELLMWFDVITAKANHTYVYILIIAIVILL